jgi:hypothetical protein
MSIPPNFWDDSLRVVVFAFYAPVMGQGVAVVWAYLKAYRVKADTGPEGLLPMPVLLVLIALTVLATEAVWNTFTRIGQPLLAWSVLNLVIFAVSDGALFVLWRHERDRVTRPDDEETTPVSSRLTRAS